MPNPKKLSKLSMNQKQKWMIKDNNIINRHILTWIKILKIESVLV